MKARPEDLTKHRELVSVSNLRILHPEDLKPKRVYDLVEVTKNDAQVEITTIMINYSLSCGFLLLNFYELDEVIKFETNLVIGV